MRKREITRVNINTLIAYFVAFIANLILIATVWWYWQYGEPIPYPGIWVLAFMYEAIFTLYYIITHGLEDGFNQH